MKSGRTIGVIALDLDNTLIDRDRAFRECLGALAQSHGCTLAAESLQRVVTFDQSGRSDRLATMELLAWELGLPEGNAPAWWEATKRLLPDFVTPDQRAIRLLAALARQYSLALVSNGDGVLQRAKLQRAGLAEFFPERLILISGELGMKKPGGEIFAEAIARTGEAAGNILMVGDDPVNDIAGAAAAGMTTCWISRGEAWTSNPLPDMTVRDVLELTMVLPRTGRVAA